MKGSKNTLLDRKSDHIELAFQSQTDKSTIDERFYYEPMLAGHQQHLPQFTFDGKKLGAPIWVSSMTGGTEKAHKINHNLARACAEFGMGMGLGSCRPLLESNERFDDFNLRPLMGDNLPLYANLGIAQIEHLLTLGKQQQITDLVKRLQADGLIVHVNPMQEWLQPEGDRFGKTPIELITELLDKTELKIIVKEVGQGFGPQSMKALLKMPLVAVDFAAHGGTNFALLEMLRHTGSHFENYSQLAQIGHDANEMVEMANRIVDEEYEVNTPQLIISGGIKNFLDGYYLIQKSHMPAVYGQASALLKHAQQGYDYLVEYLTSQIEGLKLAHSYLRIKR
ncbi:type 2 isopentenyl-diphosphate Delta-isomerase [bacterium]|nr:type 2 isopentenyl-diphosphate Delta-isomerase [bacterium]